MKKIYFNQENLNCNQFNSVLVNDPNKIGQRIMKCCWVFVLFLIFILGLKASAQCSNFQQYESFANPLSLPVGWLSNSISVGTNSPRTGDNQLNFDGVGDFITTPIIANPGIFSFWYARNGQPGGSPQYTVETSPNNATWTTRGTTGTFNTTYNQFTLNLGALSLTNVYVRIRDTRGNSNEVRGNSENYEGNMRVFLCNSFMNNKKDVLLARSMICFVFRSGLCVR